MEQPPQVVQLLKSDVFGSVELLDGSEGPCVRRIASGSRVPGARWLARRFLANERRALEQLDGIDGVARALDRPHYARAPALSGDVPDPRDVLLRSWIEGRPLWSAESLPRDYFERLEDLVRVVHGRGVCHNDLHKEPNVLVRLDGSPALLDFQLASVHFAFGRTHDVRAAEDIRHVLKHRRRYIRGTGLIADAVDARLPRRRSLLARVWMRLGKPVYNFVTRRLFDLEDGEPRRPSTGPWPKWTPALGPQPLDDSHSSES